MNEATDALLAVVGTLAERCNESYSLELDAILCDCPSLDELRLLNPDILD